MKRQRRSAVSTPEVFVIVSAFVFFLGILLSQGFLLAIAAVILALSGILALVSAARPLAAQWRSPAQAGSARIMPTPVRAIREASIPPQPRR